MGSKKVWWALAKVAEEVEQVLGGRRASARAIPRLGHWRSSLISKCSERMPVLWLFRLGSLDVTLLRVGKFFHEFLNCPC